MKRILMTASTLSHFQNFHLPYLKSLSGQGAVVTLGCPLSQEIELQGVHEILSLPFQKKMFSLHNIKASFMLRRKLSQFDLVVTHTALASFFTRLAALGLKNPPRIICVVHGYLFHGHSSNLQSFVLRSAERLVAPVTDIVLTMNRWDYHQAKKYALGKHVYHIDGMGLPAVCADPCSADTLRSSLGMDDHSFLLGFGGEFSARKNQTFLIKSMANLSPNFHLVLAGEGETLASCRALVTPLGLENRVHFLGLVPNLPEWYLACDVVVSASISEGLPFHLMEAMSLGCAVVVSDVKGHCDLVEERASGLLFPLGDTARFVAQVNAMTNDITLKQQLQQRAKQQSRHYSLDYMLPKIMYYYTLSQSFPG